MEPVRVGVSEGVGPVRGGASERVEQVRVGARKHFVSKCMENK